MAGFTIGDLIRSSMRKIGVLAAGEPLPADEGDDALQVLISMVDAWALESYLIPVVGVVTHELQPNVPEYTIGVYPEPVPVPLPLNHIETARPEKIISAFIRDQYNTDYVLEAIYAKTFSGISRKTDGSRPSRFYVREGWPLNEILFESVPYANETLHLEVLQPLSQVLPVAGLTEVINLPPGYRRALEYNLAMDLADEWGKQPSSMIAVSATEGKKWIKRANYRPLKLGMDRAVATTQRAKGTYVITSGP